ncbi:MAG: hypothetical protein NTW68_14960 [candidate division NC10 bacterium]|nr:hypothetical protein [candidate division NC10 bacterium]
MRCLIAGIAVFCMLISGARVEGQSLIPPPPGSVKVSVEFRRIGQRTQGGADLRGTGPGGTIVQVSPQGVRGSAQLRVQESQQRVRQTAGSFLFIQDGAEGRLAVLDQSLEIVWFQQYAARHSYITAGVVLREVGTAFLVRPTILPNRQIRLKITPHLSYRTEEGEGAIEMVDASTEVVVQSGQPVTIGGSDRDGEVVRQFLLGYERVNHTGQVSIILTAEAP